MTTTWGKMTWEELVRAHKEREAQMRIAGQRSKTDCIDWATELLRFPRFEYHEWKEKPKRPRFKPSLVTYQGNQTGLRCKYLGSVRVHLSKIQADLLRPAFFSV